MIASPKDRRLLYKFSVAGMDFLMGSDHHVSLADAAVFTDCLNQQIACANVPLIVLPGDLYETRDGQSAQAAIGNMLNSIGRHNPEKIVIYVPGNHCLRGAGPDAWSHFGTLPKNIIAPLENPTAPITLDSNHGKILIGNIFYDFRLLEPAILGLEESDIRKFYEENLPDGQYLLRCGNEGRMEDLAKDERTRILGGSTDLFPIMADNLAKALTPDISILVTHCVPHPSLVTFRAAARTTDVAVLEQKFGVPFICDPEEDGRKSRHFNMTPQQYRDRWNKKSFAMGSNVLTRTGADPRNGLAVLSGHSHRSENGLIRRIDNKDMIFYSFQVPMFEPKFQGFIRERPPRHGL